MANILRSVMFGVLVFYVGKYFLKEELLIKVRGYHRVSVLDSKVEELSENLNMHIAPKCAK